MALSAIEEFLSSVIIVYLLHQMPDLAQFLP
jgi:hypothetical protein